MERDEGQESLDLRATVGVIRRRILLVLFCAVATGGIALGLSLLQEKQYSATASLLFRDAAFDARLFGEPAASTGDPSRAAATNTELVSLGVIADKTARELGQGFTSEDVENAVSIGVKGVSNVVSVTATDPDPATAAELANAYSNAYIDFQKNADRAKVVQTLKLAEKRFDALNGADKNGKEGRSLRDEISRLKTLASLQTGDAELVQPADVPQSPTSPRPLRNTALGAALGLLLGLGIALLAERFNRRLRDPDELEEFFTMPLLGTIPASEALSSDSDLHELPPVEAEAFRMLRGRLRHHGVGSELKCVLVTSGEAQDGKSTVAFNLAVAEASVGSSTLLVECDFRRPSVAARHGLRPTRGLAELLTSTAAEDGNAFQQLEISTTPASEGPPHYLDVVVAGATPPNPADLLESNEMAGFLDYVKTQYDLVVIDTPPVTIVSDVMPLLDQVDGVVVVAATGGATYDSAAAVEEQLRSVNAPILGVVANKSRTRAGYGTGYYYAANGEAVGALRVGARS